MRFEYIYPDGRRRKLSEAHEKVWEMGTTGPQKPIVETLFIGSSDELKRSPLRMNDVVRDMQQMKGKFQP